MKNSLLLISSLFCSALAFGCADDKDQANTTNTSKVSATNVSDSASSTGSDETDPTNPTNASNVSNATNPTDGGTTDGASATDPGTGSTGCSFLDCTSGSSGGLPPGCDVWAQDCPDGQKCGAIISDGGSAWDTVACVPVGGSGQPGDSCMSESVAAGLDDCAKGVMCWDVDDMGVGTCVKLCEGTPDAPVCPNQGVCTIANDGSLTLCLPNCSPLLQDCPEGNACYPVNDGFTCAPDASGDTGVANDPCEFINVCEAGLMCANAEFVGAGCPQGSTSCCTPFCDLTDANVKCPNPDQSCVEFYDPMNVPINPPDAKDIGVCGIPG